MSINTPFLSDKSTKSLLLSRIGVWILKMVCVLYFSTASFAMAVELNSGHKGLSGIVFDQTQSPMAKAFAREFSRVWSQSSLSGAVNISVEETLSARWGKQVVVIFQDRVLFRTAVHQRVRSWDDQIQQANGAVRQGVAAQLQAKRFSADPDLARDEI